jgi:hypothetical protein
VHTKAAVVVTVVTVVTVVVVVVVVVVVSVVERVAAVVVGRAQREPNAPPEAMDTSPSGHVSTQRSPAGSRKRPSPHRRHVLPAAVTSHETHDPGH